MKRIVIGAMLLIVSLTVALVHFGSAKASTIRWQAPAGVPARYAGPMREDYTGLSLFHWMKDVGAGGSCRYQYPERNVTYYAKYKWVRLHTNGEVNSCSEIVSPGYWTSGVFEARVWFPASPGGQIADFPAYWMSGPGPVWPKYGEIDAAEGIYGWLTATWHWNLRGPYGSYSPAEIHHRLITTAPGWYTIDIIRQSNTGVQIWYNGHRVWMYDTHYKVMPEDIILDITNFSPGSASNMYVDSVKIWNYK